MVEIEINIIENCIGLVECKRLDKIEKHTMF